MALPVEFVTATVTAVVPDKKGYFINPDGDQAEQYARPLDTGIHRPYELGEKVLAFHSPATGWSIMGRIMMPVKYLPDDAELTGEQQEQIQESHDLLYAMTGISKPEELPNYRHPAEDIDEPGDITISNPLAPGRIRLTADGSIVMDTEQYVSGDQATDKQQGIPLGSILSFLLSSGAGDNPKSAVLRMGELILDFVDGFDLTLTKKSGTAPDIAPSDEAYTGGVTDVAKEEPKLRLSSTLSSDPTKIDFDLEAGRCRDMNDFKFGASQKSLGKFIKRGLKVKIGTFAYFEIDLDNYEIRLTILDPDNIARFQTEKFQIRVNPEEFTITRPGTGGATKQFFSIQDKGIFLKGDLIGLGGPWAMWSAADLATLDAALPIPDALTTPDKQVGKWDETNMGLNIAKSLTLGDLLEPAVVQGFLNQHYAAMNQDMVDIITELLSHTHVASGFGAPTTPGAATMPNTAGKLANFVKAATLFSDTTGKTFQESISIYV